MYSIISLCPASQSAITSSDALLLQEIEQQEASGTQQHVQVLHVARCFAIIFECGGRPAMLPKWADGSLMCH
jgi:hypothetical protein